MRSCYRARSPTPPRSAANPASRQPPLRCTPGHPPRSAATPASRQPPLRCTPGHPPRSAATPASRHSPIRCVLGQSPGSAMNQGSGDSPAVNQGWYGSARPARPPVPASGRAPAWPARQPPGRPLSGRPRPGRPGLDWPGSGRPAGSASSLRGSPYSGSPYSGSPYSGSSSYSGDDGWLAGSRSSRCRRSSPAARARPVVSRSSKAPRSLAQSGGRITEFCLLAAVSASWRPRDPRPIDLPGRPTSPAPRPPRALDHPDRPTSPG